MKNVIRLCSLFFIFSLVFLQSVESEPKWELLGDKNNVKYYQAPVPGSEFLQFKGVATVDAGLENIIALLRDVPAYQEWVLDCKECTLIEAQGGNDKNICYYVYNSQFPVKDRDTFVKTFSTNNIRKNGSMDLKIDSTELKSYNLPGDLVKMDLHVQFTSRIIARNKTETTMCFKFDPGGTISPGLVHGFVRKLPYHSLVNLQKMVKKSKYVKLAKKVKEIKDIEVYAKRAGK